MTSGFNSPNRSPSSCEDSSDVESPSGPLVSVTSLTNGSSPSKRSTPPKKKMKPSPVNKSLPASHSMVSKAYKRTAVMPKRSLVYSETISKTVNRGEPLFTKSPPKCTSVSSSDYYSGSSSSSTKMKPSTGGKSKRPSSPSSSSSKKRTIRMSTTPDPPLLKDGRKKTPSSKSKGTKNKSIVTESKFTKVPDRLEEVARDDKRNLNDLFLMIFTSRKTLLKDTLKKNKHMDVYESIKMSHLKPLKARIQANRISSGGEFLNELELMVDHFKGDKILASAIRKFYNDAKVDIFEAKRCFNCVHNYYSLDPEEVFVAVCQYPHMIVWAKFSGEPFWPAKVIRVDSDKMKVEVKFFGEHTKSTLDLLADPPVVYFYTRTYYWWEKFSFGKKKERSLELAIHEAKEHVKQIKKEHRHKLVYHDDLDPYPGYPLYLETDGKSLFGSEDQSAKSSEGDNSSDGFVEETHDGFSGQLKLRELMTDHRFQPHVLIHNDLDQVILKYPSQLVSLNVMDKNGIEEYKREHGLWDPNEYSEESDVDYDNPPGIDPMKISEDDEDYVKYCMTYSQAMMYENEKKRKSMIQEIKGLRGEIQHVREDSEKELNREFRRRNKMSVDLMVELERERVNYLAALTNGTLVELISLTESYEKEIRELKKRPHCIRCYKPALEEFSGSSIFCSKNCRTLHEK